MEKEKKIIIAKNCAFITLGCIIYSLGVALFLDPYGIASGGVTGIAIIINYATNDVIGTGWLILIINVPLFIIGAIFFGKTFIISSIISTALSSGLIELWAKFVVPHIPIMGNSLIAPVVGGALFGFGLGLIFRAGSSTGGTDIIVKLLRRKFRHLRTGIISMAVDVVIVAAAGFVYKDMELLILTVLSIIVFTVMFDRALYGGSSAILVHIVTTEDKVQPICDGILNDLDSSATIFDAKGAYSQQDKAVIMCVIKNFLYPRLRDIIKKYDETAFTIVSSAKEIYGEGFKDHNAEEL
ncbi:MAG: YitT family protein [Clostridia bacterium]|nr:YitT family protein [Clostridia bacterium]